MILSSQASGIFPFLNVGYFSIQEAGSFEATPNNSYELLLLLSGEVATYKETRFRSTGLLGMHAEAFRIGLGPGAAGLHIRLHPHQLYQFVDVPLRELAQHPLELAELWGQEATYLHEKVLAATGPGEKIRLVEHFLAQRYRNKDTRAAQFIPELLKSNQTEVSVKQLRESMRLSERQLERLFAEQVGTAPRTYLKISRFQRVATWFAQRKTPVSLLSLALQAGYYDQSHFIRDCKQLTGRTPEAYFMVADPVLSGSYNTK